MVSTLIARLAMITSFAYYSLTMALVWVAWLLGETDVVLDVFEMPPDSAAPPLWFALIGIALSVIMLGGLGSAYWSIEKMLRGGAEQDFSSLARRLKRAGAGLMVFWFSYNVMIGVMPILLSWHMIADLKPSYDWDPLDVDIIILIVGIALYALSHALHRASAVEEENKQFL